MKQALCAIWFEHSDTPYSYATPVTRASAPKKSDTPYNSYAVFNIYLSVVRLIVSTANKSAKAN
jgi:hypothetical protein